MDRRGINSSVWGGRSDDFHRLLRDIEGRYIDAFRDLGSEAVKDLEVLIQRIKRFHDRLLSDWVNPLIKRMDHGGMRELVYEFCGHYSKFLGSSLMEKLEHDLYEVLEEDVRKWLRRRGRHEVMGV